MKKIVASRLHNLILKVYLRGRTYRRLLKDERNAVAKPKSIRQRIGYLALGFNSDKANLYGPKASLKRYWSDIDANKVRAFNRTHGLLLDRKDIFHAQMARLGYGPKALGMVNRGLFYPAENEVALSVADMLRSLPKGAVIRSISGTGFGHRLIVLNEALFAAGLERQVDGEERVIPLQEALTNGQWLVLNPIHQKARGYAESLCPGSWNSISVTTLRRPESQLPFVAFATQRIGEDNNRCYALIDRDIGVLGPAAQLIETPPWKRFLDFFPESGRAIAGVHVDEWETAKRTVLNVHKALPGLIAATWHLLQTDAGYRIIGAGNKLDVRAYQLHRPLLENQQVKQVRDTHLRRPRKH